MASPTMDEEDETSPDLVLSTPADGAFLDRTQKELEAIVLGRLTAAHVRRVYRWRPRWMRHGTSFASWRILRIVDSRIYALAMSALCLAGLVLALQAAPGEHFLENRAQDLALFALAPLVFWLPLRRLAAWADGYTARRPRSRFLAPAARYQARSMLKQARKLAPFIAEYTFTGSAVTYTRVKDEDRAIAWTRPLADWRQTGDHVTLLYKTEAAELHDALILHTQPDELIAYLSAHGVRPLPSSAAQ